MNISRTVNIFLALFGIKVSRIKNTRVKFNRIPELPREIVDLIESLLNSDLTMVSRERLYATALSVKYVCENKIEGDFVECGVWRGGNVILAAKVFEYFSVSPKLWLYDTFEGMTKPNEKDLSQIEGAALKQFESLQKANSKWCYSDIEEVKSNLRSYGVNLAFCKFIVGDVIETLEKNVNIPEKISVLRLDTDWYESTSCELDNLYHLVSLNGVIMFDDYGYWGGHRKAVDEFFDRLGIKPLLMYIDLPGRIMQKISN